jgi:hypothetical protein
MRDDRPGLREDAPDPATLPIGDEMAIGHDKACSDATDADGPISR